MGMMIYRGDMSFDTDIRDYDLDASNGWTPDCQGKWDYDPTLVSVSSRVYPDHTWTCSVMLGENTIFESGFQKADSHEAAKVAVEKFCRRQADRVKKSICAAFNVPPPTE